MRILLLNQFYPPDVAATGQLLADLAAGLAQRGHEVHVVCSRGAYGGGAVRYPKRSVTDGITVHRLSAFGFGRKSLWGRLADYASFYAAAGWRAFTLGRIDVCVSLTTPPFLGLIGALLRLRGTRLILWIMDVYPEVAAAYGYLKRDGMPLRLLRGLSRRLYARASCIIALGEVMAERLKQAGARPEKTVVVHNWVPGESIRPIPLKQSEARKTWNPDDRVTLMYSGNLGIGHELDTALHAVHLLAGQQDLRVLFVGEGKMREPLVRLAQELGLDDVSFHPSQPLSALSDSLAAGDIHLVSQRDGTQGLIVPSKLYGVMAAARPVLFIGPEDCEVAKILHESRSGLIAPCGDRRAAAEALRQLAADAAQREEMGRRGREFYEAHFGLCRSVSTLVKLIEQA